MDPNSSLPFMMNYGANPPPNSDITNFDFNYDYGNTVKNSSTSTVWDELAAPVENVSKAVWSTAQGTWDSVKGAATSALSTVESTTGGIFDSLLMRVILIFAVLVLGLWILGKAGIIHDVAGALKP